MNLIHVVGGSIAGITAFTCSFYYGFYLAVALGLVVVFATAEIDNYLETKDNSSKD